MGRHFRRAAAVATVLTVPLAGLALTVPAIGATVRSHSTGVTWSLVSRPCTATQVPTGRGCWDGTGGPTWQVHETSATEMNSDQWEEQETYAVPSSVGPDGAAVPLSLTVTSFNVTAGIADEVCIQSDFGVVGNANPCIQAYANGPHMTASKTGTILLSPINNEPPGTKFNLTVELGNGGSIAFTYQAQGAPPAPKPVPTSTSTTPLAPAHHISFTFRATFSKPSGGAAKDGAAPQIVMTGSGGFTVRGTPKPPPAELLGTSPSGTTTVTLNGFIHPYTATLTLIQAWQTATGIVGTYQVSQSNALACLPPGGRVTVEVDRAGGRNTIYFDPICAQGGHAYGVSTAAISIKSM